MLFHRLNKAMNQYRKYYNLNINRMAHRFWLCTTNSLFSGQLSDTFGQVREI